VFAIVLGRSDDLHLLPVVGQADSASQVNGPAFGRGRFCLGAACVIAANERKWEFIANYSV